MAMLMRYTSFDDAVMAMDNYTETVWQKVVSCFCIWHTVH
jgi:hypothetical protein